METKKAARSHAYGEVEALALPFMNRLYRTALILTGSPRFAKSLLHETCLKVRHGYHRFHNDNDFGIWMFRILLDAFWLNRHRVEPQQGDSFNLNPAERGELSLDFFACASPKNNPAKYPFGEMTLPPVCAYIGM
jgi:DNA-directed RNA polymerase specialized sigma24 family protein